MVQGGPGRMRMSSFDCNMEGTKGYFAAICGLHSSKLYADHPGAEVPCRGELDGVLGGMLWAYMPIDLGEYLEEIWAVRHPFFFGCIALMVRISSLIAGTPALIFCYSLAPD